MMFKFGVIGTGMIAQYGHDGIKASGKAECVSVCDSNQARLRDFANLNGIGKTFTDAADLLADKETDAVYIAVPNALHAPYAEAALLAGKHVLLDKPFALNLREAQRVAAAAQKSGKLFMLGMNHRFTEESQKIKSLAEKGYFGEIYHAMAYWRRRSGIPKAGTWFGHKALSGGGSLLDIGVHMLDLSLYLMDNFEAEAVSGATYTKFGNRGLGFGSWGKSDPQGLAFDVDDLATAFIRLKGGASVNLQVSWACNQKEKDMMNVEIHGTEAGASCYPAEVYHFDTQLGALINVGGLNPEIRYPHKERGINFVRAALGEEAPCVTVDQALKVQGILDGIYRSALDGREVRL
jgi:predicted dehydrogenase